MPVCKLGFKDGLIGFVSIPGRATSWAELQPILVDERFWGLHVLEIASLGGLATSPTRENFSGVDDL